MKLRKIFVVLPVFLGACGHVSKTDVGTVFVTIAGCAAGVALTVNPFYAFSCLGLLAPAYFIIEERFQYSLESKAIADNNAELEKNIQETQSINNDLKRKISVMRNAIRNNQERRDYLSYQEKDKLINNRRDVLKHIDFVNKALNYYSGNDNSDAAELRNKLLIYRRELKYNMSLTNNLL